MKINSAFVQEESFSMFFPDFIKNRKESAAQASIYHCLTMLSSFQETPVTLHDGIAAQDTIEGEKQFYQYIKNLYVDMYHYPGKYEIDSSRYDDYIGKLPQPKGKPFVEKQHQQDSKESSLRNEFQQSITFYFKFLYELGQVAQICKDTFSLHVTFSSYENAVKNARSAKVSGKENQKARILLDSGLKQRELESTYEIFSEEYPKMFLGLAVLCKAPESKYKWMNYLRLDYKRFYSSMPEMSDILETVSEQAARNMTDLTDSFKTMPLKTRMKPLRNITSDFKWKMEFTYKGKSCFGFYADWNSLLVCVYFHNAKNITLMAEKLCFMDPDLFRWYCEHIPERMCNCPNNRWVTLGEDRRRICGMSNRMDVSNPLKADTERCLKIMQVFREI